MRRSTTLIDVPTEDRTSLGLRTRRPFELQLLEIAIGGRRALKKYWKEEGERFHISEQVVCLEILHEFEEFEKNGSMDTLVGRARNQVVKMKGNKDLHHRALLVYRYYLNLSISRESFNCISQTRSEESLSARERESKTYSRSSQVLHIDERLDLMMGVELPETQDEESSTQPESGTKNEEGEPRESSCEVASLFDDNMSCETLSIFERPIETEGFISSGVPGFREKSLSEKWLYAERSEERDSLFSIQDSINSQVSPKYMTWNDDELKIDPGSDKQPQIRRSFPGKDFEKPIEWKVDKITYKATSISDLRKNHDIVIQGSFRKRGGKCYIWRNYYGFVLNTGIMLYFRKEAFKRAADLRKSTPSIAKGKQFKLNIQGLYVESKPAEWLLKFANEKKLKTWYETILKFSKSRNNDGLEQLQGSPKKVAKLC